jgi:undecaprenyl-diphosphatase
MHAYLNMILLAVLQGVTEFLPVSSSAHLVIAAKILNFKSPGLQMEMVLHAGTLLAICLYYRQRLLALATGLVRRERTAWIEAGYLLLATVPVVVVYFFAHDWLDSVYDNYRFAGAMLLVTGVALLSLNLREWIGSRAHRVERAQEAQPMVAWRAVAIGVAQAFAILPGISRSGATIVTARHCGLSPKRAAEFSFFMSIPPLLGGTLISLCSRDSTTGMDLGWGLMALGLAVAAVVGYVSISILMRVLNRGRFWLFGVYCLIVGGAVLLIGL